MWLLANLCQAPDSRLVCIDTWAGAEQYSNTDAQVCLVPACVLPQSEYDHAYPDQLTGGSCCAFDRHGGWMRTFTAASTWSRGLTLTSPRR